MKICGDRNIFKPILIFKGNLGGRIKRGLTSFYADCHFGVQEKSWMDEQLVHFWIDKVVGPGIVQACH